MVDYRLRPLEPCDVAAIWSWARSAEEREAWAAITELAPPPDVFDRWHAARVRLDALAG